MISQKNKNKNLKVAKAFALAWTSKTSKTGKRSLLPRNTDIRQHIVVYQAGGILSSVK